MLLALGVLLPTAALGAPPNNLLLFVPDGLRSQIVDATTAPAMTRLREEGVNFANSHSLFPTFTTANASALATGHQLGDTGDFSNYIYGGFPIPSSGNTVTPFLEIDPVLRDMKGGYHGNYLNEESIVALAAAAHYSTALVGKVGPVAIFDLGSLDEAQDDHARSLIVDDTTGHDGGVKPSQRWEEAFRQAGVPWSAPGRGANGDSGNIRRPGTLTPNGEQQRYFLDVTLKVVLPEFKRAGRPFVLVYWSRDPDGTQHNQGDSFGSLRPGISGPTSLAAIRGADDALAEIEAALKTLGMFATTNIVVSADHGFSTISKESHSSPAAALGYADVRDKELPLGFLAIDLTVALRKADPELRLFDPDDNNAAVDWTQRQHPRRGNGIIGKDPASPEVIVAANGGSDLVYLPAALSKARARRLGRAVVDALLDQDYVSGVFVDESRIGEIPGALPMSLIGLSGTAVTPHPAIVVNFRSVATGCDRPSTCTAIVADTALQQGQGMHGSFSRSDTWNFMAARGPDFRTGFIDPLPTSNADVGFTIARLLQLRVVPKGKLTGRILAESLRANSGMSLPGARTRTFTSQPSRNGMKTILKTQSVGTAVYFDRAGFPGRTVGVE